MILKFSKYYLQTTNLVVVLCLTISMFWCGDINCFNDNNTEQCSTLVCEFIGSHQNSPSNPDDNHSDNCTCICHIPAIASVLSIVSSSFQPENNTVVISFSIPTAPVQNIYHPPKA
ncbi:MAG: hypothetical protein HZB59_09990 [Ignavibacteriales bacterium]|nr:hypothetical protein [Ignavibacteriales bacterium]